MNQPSHWTDTEAWQARLAADVERLAALLTEEDRGRRRGPRRSGDGGLDFLVVYGSVARGERHVESDLDIYFEASDLAREFNRTDPNHCWHVFGLPSGAARQPTSKPTVRLRSDRERDRRHRPGTAPRSAGCRRCRRTDTDRASLTWSMTPFVCAARCQLTSS